MNDETKKFYSAVSNVIFKVREAKNIKYTELCYANDIPQSTFDDIMNAKTKASFYNVAKVVKGLGMNFEEFGKLLDKELPIDFLN